MGSLTVALAILAGVVLAAVVAHGAWQARRAAARREVTAPSSGPREPVFADAVAERLEPVGPVGPPANEPRAQRRSQVRLDALIDALATLALDTPVSGEHVLVHLPATRRAGSKPFAIEGLNAATSEWETPQPGARYGELQAGVQMVNRGGALNEIEFSEFVQKVQAFADAVGATPDFPDMLDVVARARELDAFASERDAQLAVHLRARGAAWSPGFIQQHAARHGFVPGLTPGRLVLPAQEEGAPPVLVLSFDPIAALAEEPSQSAVRDATLSFDVPQTARGTEPFAAWQASAQALAHGMDADLVDDDGRPLSEAGFAAIGAELGKLYDALAGHDLAAGSAAARRLFS